MSSCCGPSVGPRSTGCSRYTTWRSAVESKAAESVAFCTSSSAHHTCAAAEAFITVPQTLLLHAGLCNQDPIFGHAFSQLQTEAGANLDGRHLLCLLLVVERAKGSKSLWHPYIQFLPQTYGTVHCFCCGLTEYFLMICVCRKCLSLSIL